MKLAQILYGYRNNGQLFVKLADLDVRPCNGSDGYVITSLSHNKIIKLIEQSLKVHDRVSISYIDQIMSKSDNIDLLWGLGNIGYELLFILNIEFEQKMIDALKKYKTLLNTSYYKYNISNLEQNPKALTFIKYWVDKLVRYSKNNTITKTNIISDLSFIKEYKNILKLALSIMNEMLLNMDRINKSSNGDKIYQFIKYCWFPPNNATIEDALEKLGSVGKGLSLLNIART
ncbi:unnamed protein product [marine sediment metagenome]|uniref:Uncharacterized protein n=1 Tax=marine sediment metagenome TaxID=412755 RepID=X1AC09_9ZZZZ